MSISSGATEILEIPLDKMNLWHKDDPGLASFCIELRIQQSQ